jgi:glycosyltransferase involved in cell wall biosynthesis
MGVKPTCGKILVLANSCWHIYHYHLALLQFLQQQSYYIVTAAPFDSYLPQLQKAGINAHHNLQHLAPHNRNPWKEGLFFWEIIKLIRKEKPDFILSYTIKPNLYGSLAAKWWGIPILPTVTGLGYAFLHQKGINRLIPHLYRWAFRGLSQVVFQNVDDLNLFVQRRIIKATQGLLIRGSGIDLNWFAPTPIIKTSSQPLVFLYLGRLLADKGLRELAAAAQFLRSQNCNIEVWIAGEMQTGYPARIRAEELESWVASDAIRYWSHQEDVRPLLAASHVFVLPSYREGLSRALLEALAMGRPILTTDVAGCRDAVIPGKNGYLVPARDASALAEAMAHFATKTAAELTEMGQVSTQLADAVFSNEVVINAYCEILLNRSSSSNSSSPALQIIVSP